ncbi:glycosyltransferase family 39 protein, partial [Allocoleopsis sp.]|uniref:ArnT family glycosyltransferase n=1 Tax=Allocoleopsis sp. TaxID=3088169 RepID=UPI002FD30B47
MPHLKHSPTETQWFLGFLIAAFVLWGIALGNVPLRDWDEGTRALVAREIYRTGNWLYPTLQGKSYLLKPPLMDWLIALSYKIGGVHEFTTRLPGAFLSACGVPLLYLVGRELFRQSLPAVFAASVYLTLLPVVRHGRLAMLDGTAVTFFLLLLLCLLKSRQDRRWAVGVGFGVGLIGFTKGLLVVPLAAIAFSFLLADRQFALLKSPYLWLGLLLGNLPVLAWYAAQWQHYGANFVQVHFQSQGLERLSQSVENHGGAPWYYLLELLKYTWPWMIFWPGGLYLAWQKRRSSWGCLVLIGTIGYLATISVMNTKLPWYIMPVYPFFALAVAAQLAEFWQHSQRYPRFLVWIFGFLAIAGLAGCVYFILADPQPVLIIMGGVVALTMGTVAWYIQQNNPRFILILLLGMYLTLGLLMTSKSWLWELNEAFPVKPVAALIQAHTPPEAVVYMSFAYGRPSLSFYSDRRVIPGDVTTLQQLWSTKPYLLLDRAALAALQL